MLTEVFVISLKSSEQIPGQYLKLLQDCFFISFPVHYSLIILSFDYIESELLAASLNKP
jgi:hypothetical protein